MAVLSPPPPDVRSRTRWLGRRNVLLADAAFGLLLLAIAFAGKLTMPAQPAPNGQVTAAPVEIAAHFGGLMPPGQSTGLAVASDGTLAIVDRGREVIRRLDANGKPIAEWGPQFGPGLDAKDLVGITRDGEGWAVLDRGALRILRLDDQGHAQPDRTIDLSKLETYGPNGLASDGKGNLLLADTGRDRVVIFNAGGTMTGSFGSAGNDLGKFKQPMFLAFAPDGTLFVSDWENSRIEHFDETGHAINAWPLPTHAWGIAVDSQGRVFAPDGDHHLVRMFAPDGSLLAQIGAEQGSSIPLDGISQVGASPYASRLWVLGNDGLARVDLSPYASLRPGGASQAVKTPLAVLGALLLALAGLGFVWPQLSTAQIPRSVRVWRRPETVSAQPITAPRPTVTVEGVPRITPAWVSAVGALLLVAGGVGAVVAEAAVADPISRIDPWPRLLWLVVASLVFAAGSLLTRMARPWRWVTQTWPGRDFTALKGRIDWIAVGAAVPVVALAVVAGLTWWLQGHFQTPQATRGALVWLAALGLTVVALVRVSDVERPTLWALIPWALFVVALIPRAWNNADLPFGVWFDEAEGGLQARRFLQAALYTPITDTYGRDASLQYYAMAGAQALIEDPVLADRLVSAVIGALCAPLMYFLGRELFGWRVGVIAGLVIATLRWHLDVSRLGWDPISLPLCAILAFWLLARAIRTGRWSHAVWAGLAIGLGMHAYVGYRVLPLVAFALLLYGGWLRRWSILGFAGRVGVVVGSAVLSALPVIIFAIQDPAGFNGRLNQTLVLNEQVSQSQKLDELWSNVQKHALMFHVSGDMNGRHNLPGAPMLDPLSGLLMVIGLAVLALRPLDWRAWLVFGWAAASMAGGIFTFPFEAPQAMRTLGVTPVLALVIALGLVLALDRAVAFIRGWRRIKALAGGAVMSVAVVWLGVTSLTTFFGRQMNDPTVWESFSTRETLPSRAALAASTPYEAILGSPIIAPSLQQQLIVPTIQDTIRTFDPSADLPYRGNGPGLIVLESEHDAGIADEVARYYPDAVREPVIPPNGVKPTADEIVLSEATIASHRGLAASRQPDGTFRADIGVDAPGAYAFEVPSGFTLLLDGASLSTGHAVMLARGNHLAVLSGPPTGPAPTLQWEMPGTTTFQAIEDRLIFSAPDGGNGLRATFYPTPDFQGTPTETIIDPILAHYYHINPLSRVNASPATWSAEWRGTIDVPTTGTYRFEADRLSRAGVWIDENVVFDDTPDGAIPNVGGSVPLTAGRHAIRVRMQDRGDGGPHLYLYWTPPGGGRELVPGRVLYPPPPDPAG